MDKVSKIFNKIIYLTIKSLSNYLQIEKKVYVNILTLVFVENISKSTDLCFTLSLMYF